MKNFLSFALLSISFAINAQNLEAKIPSSSEVVITTNGNRIFDLVAAVDINASFIGKEILKDANKNREDKINSIEELGFDLASKAYYFLELNDSITYHNFLIPINNREQFEATLSKYDKEKVKSDGTSSYIESYNGIIVWNNNLFLFVDGMKSYAYFKEHKERFKKEAETEEELEYSIHKRIVNSWIKKHAFNIFNTNAERSIISNSKFQASKHKDAVGTVWVKNYGMVLSQMMSAYSRMLSPSYLVTRNKNFYGFEEIVGNLFFDKDAVRFSLDMAIAPAMQKSFKKIYNKKIDKKFFNHFDQEKAMAFWSFSFDTQAMFEEYPNLVNTIYGGMLPSFKEEVEVSTDLFSLLLDEEAIGELITGDMLFVLNDVVEKEVEYITYEYDEDYKSKEVKKTKKEPVPDFTIMIGSEKQTLLNKLYRLGIKHKIMRADAGAFQFVFPKRGKVPFDLYSVFKNDILFLTTSKAKADNIVKNRNSNTSEKYTKLIKKNASVFYINGQKIVSRIPEKELGKKEKKMLDLFSTNFKDAYLKSSKLKGNKMSSELKINTNGNQENSLKLLFKLMNEVAN